MRTKDEASFPSGKARPHRLRAGGEKAGGEKKDRFRTNKSPLRKIARAFFIILLPILVASALYLLPPDLRGERAAKAANPASGIIATTGPVVPFTGTWTGTATGGSSANGESTCVEGVNCDTFRLTVAPGDYTGKQIAIKIQ